jgi:2-polyprenyl-3-methyl-5-hydroxy-6-metoxy-1,4-benzoquinol methylase
MNVNNMENIKCIFCDTWNDQIVIEENGYKGRKCLQCGLIYISPRPKLEQILNLYSEDKANIYAESIIPDEFAKRLQSKLTLGIIKKYIKSGSMLEIGAGAGFFLDEARKIGFKVYGLEINKIQSDFINKTLRIPCETSLLEESAFKGEFFNIIYHCNVLSHFYDPILEFIKISERLIKKGIVVFETGNLAEVEEKYYQFYTTFEYPDHLFFYSEKSLKQLMEITGFEILQIYKYSLLPNFYKKRMIDAIKQVIINKGERGKVENSNAFDNPSRDTNDLSFKKIIKKANIYFSYFLIYCIGYLLRKRGRPQTVIIVAQKK